jgi:hypothetical protein
VLAVELSQQLTAAECTSWPERTVVQRFAGDSAACTEGRNSDQVWRAFQPLAARSSQPKPLQVALPTLEISTVGRTHHTPQLVEYGDLSHNPFEFLNSSQESQDYLHSFSSIFLVFKECLLLFELEHECGRRTLGA